jgi:hypothetical protein
MQENRGKEANPLTGAFLISVLFALILFPYCGWLINGPLLLFLILQRTLPFHQPHFTYPGTH